MTQLVQKSTKTLSRGAICQGGTGVVRFAVLKGVVFALLVVVSGLAAWGRVPADSTRVFFRQGYRYYDPNLGENRAAMDRFVNHVRQAAESERIEKIVVYGYASPEGANAANKRLSHRRCESVIKYIMDNAGVSEEIIESMPEGVAWNELRRIVAEDPDIRSREKILDIIDNVPVWIFDEQGRVIDGRKKRLMDLEGGRPYNWLYANIFPQLRNAVAISLYLKEDDSHADEAGPVEDNVTQSSADQSAEVDATVVEATNQPEAIDSTAVADSEGMLTERIPRFAIKTNILYYAALMPNLEAEWLINDNWSVGLEGDVAWYSRTSNNHNQVYRLAIISPEARYHINPRGPWHGMYVGLFAGGGLYQLQNGQTGYKGEGLMGGVSFGYMWPISKCFSLEAGIGAGYMTTRYKEYEMHDGHRLYMRTKNLSYFGPLKLKFSIAWRFGGMVKQVKDNSNL